MTYGTEGTFEAKLTDPLPPICYTFNGGIVELYRQIHPRANISIECNTNRVPTDGKYYIIKDGKVIASFRSLKAAQPCYQQLVEEIALPPLVKQENKMPSEQIMDEYFSRVSNNTLLDTSFGSKGKRTGRFHKTK